MMYTVLICDDEKDIVSALKIYLTSDGYNVLEAYNGKEAIDIIENNEVHLILMDIMMPETDGLTALIRIREKYNTPVIFTTAKSEDNDIILGLNLGADDYITKPFNPVELLARVRSQLRRYTTLGGGNFSSSTISVAGIIIDDNGKTVTVDGKEVNLTPKEYEILKLLASTPGKVFSPTDIYRHIWKDEPYGADATVAVHIRHLREKIEINPNQPRYIKVVWGQGYKIDDNKR
ncbi:MAG: response regulator transcription factor [Ruminococcaceae bacterium]|nr:response regulator transcription factor [Oscillospiraceae bacterium]